MNKLDEFLYDTRLIEKNLKKGVISESQYKEYLKNLPDLSKEIDKINYYDIVNFIMENKKSKN